MGWFLVKSLGLPRYLWAVLAIAAIVGAVLWIRAAESADDAANVEVGKQLERTHAHEEVIKQVEKANEARNDTHSRTDEQRVADCVRRSRTPENCGQRVPDVQAD